MKYKLKISELIFILLISISVSSCRSDLSFKKHYCYDLYSNGDVITDYYLRSEIARTQIGDSVFKSEIIRKIYLTDTSKDTGRIVARNNYLLLNGTLYKQFADVENKKVFLKYLSVSDTNSVSNICDEVTISQNEFRFHLVEKNESRKFLGKSVVNGDSLYQFLFEVHQIDGLRHVSYYDSEYLLVKQINIGGYTNVDSIVVKKDCRSRKVNNNIFFPAQPAWRRPVFWRMALIWCMPVFCILALDSVQCIGVTKLSTKAGHYFLTQVNRYLVNKGKLTGMLLTWRRNTY